MKHGHLPLTKWLLAIYLITQSKTNIAALALMRQLGICWKAAWLLKHKLMAAMAQREADRPLQGDVRVDDAYLAARAILAPLPTDWCGPNQMALADEPRRHNTRTSRRIDRLASGTLGNRDLFPCLEKTAAKSSRYRVKHRAARALRDGLE